MFQNFGSHFGSLRPSMFGSQIFLTKVLSHILGLCVPSCYNNEQKLLKLIFIKASKFKGKLKCSAPDLEFCPHVLIWCLLLQSLKHKSWRHSHNHMTGTASGSKTDSFCQFACALVHDRVCFIVCVCAGGLAALHLIWNVYYHPVWFSIWFGWW